VKNADAVTEYLKSILSARMGNLDDASDALRKALVKDPSLSNYAANDLELLKVKK
jgi:hypothetical protein